MHVQAHTYLYNTTHECACELQFPCMANAEIRWLGFIPLTLAVFGHSMSEVHAMY
jgi:hypothetical protein